MCVPNPKKVWLLQEPGDWFQPQLHPYPCKLGGGGYSFFTSVKWVHAKIISKFLLLLTFADALNCETTELERGTWRTKKGNANLHITCD